MIQHTLNKLYEQQSLSLTEAHECFTQIVSGNVDTAKISATLVSLKVKGETPDEIAGAAKALRQSANAFETPDYSIADCCGTGGSGQHTINISTLVAFIAAVAGIKVVKHGNRSVSSQCGSADVLERLGLNIEMSAKRARYCLDQTGVTFLFAPKYHNGVRHVMPVRNSLKTRTIFNLLGPLINPAQPQTQLMGVYSPEHCYLAAESLRLSGCKNAMVVHSCGVDEITLAGLTQVAHLHNHQIREYQLSPGDFGLPSTPLSAMKGAAPAENSKIFQRILRGEANDSINHVVAANAGTLIFLSGKSKTLKEGVKLALEIIKSGAAHHKLSELVSLSQTENLDVLAYSQKVL